MQSIPSVSYIMLYYLHWYYAGYYIIIANPNDAELTYSYQIGRATELLTREHSIVTVQSPILTSQVETHFLILTLTCTTFLSLSPNPNPLKVFAFIAPQISIYRPLDLLK